MLPRLKQLIDEVGPLHSKLILLIGPPGCGKTSLLWALAQHTGSSVMNLGLELGSRLAKLPQEQLRNHHPGREEGSGGGPSGRREAPALV
jgi:GTPase SAR1 family protein